MLPHPDEAISDRVIDHPPEQDEVPAESTFYVKRGRFPEETRERFGLWRHSTTLT
jgi:hypothetical protein